MITVVIPVRNEEKYISGCIESLILQDYPKNEMEWVFVDGCSIDKTKDILFSYMQKYPKLIKVFDNPQKITPCARNIGIEHSKGKYIIRMDAHSEYENDYISKCVYYLDTIEADNVGGVVETKSKTKIGGTIASMLSSSFGVGNSRFRTGGKDGFVDTVPFGAFKRDVFKNYGGYDERLVRNQDNEINYRIRKNGGKIYLSNNIKSSYYCRDSIKGISHMALVNGKWNIITMKLCPGSMGLRHFVPFLFVLSLVVLPALGFLWWPFWGLLGVELFLYFVLDVVFSIKSAKKINEFFLLMVLFPIFHLSYGIGSLIGIFTLFSKKYRDNKYKPRKI